MSESSPTVTYVELSQKSYIWTSSLQIIRSPCSQISFQQSSSSVFMGCYDTSIDESGTERLGLVDHIRLSFTVVIIIETTRCRRSSWRNDNWQEEPKYKQKTASLHATPRAEGQRHVGSPTWPLFLHPSILYPILFFLSHNVSISSLRASVASYC